MDAATHNIERPGVRLQAHLGGDPAGPAVCLSHSILSSSAMWSGQARLLAGLGWRVVCIDTRGHGGSRCSAATADMADLAGDVIAVLDALGIAKAHYVGLSLGGMAGFGLGLDHAHRLESLLICAARADAPAEVARPWDERMAIAQTAGSCRPLAQPTLERWFGPAFLQANPPVAQELLEVAATTTVTGFTACARAIQGLDYLERVADIRLPTTLLVGSNDGVLPAQMAGIARRIHGSVLETIADAGHLPNVDQAQAFNAALLRHLPPVRGAR